MLNPITYSERVVGDFLRYQLTTYPFADERLYAQMRALLNLEQTRATPLLKGPFVSLSRSFRTGAAVTTLVQEGLLHPHMANLVEHPTLYGHQESAVRRIAERRPTLVSTGTGSGKTECFLYPIISRCLELRDANAPDGIVAVLVYPMNALAEDQLGRLRSLLVGTGISFGMYVGKTPEGAADVTGLRLEPGATRRSYDGAVKKLRDQKQNAAVLPPDERPSREEMRAHRPRILLTNVKQLELLLTRHRDIEMFEGARLEFLVFDEAHTFSGAAGAETACLIRRLRTFCRRTPEETVCVATSATIADPERGPEAGRFFASRFFGVDADSVALVAEEYAPDLWAPGRTATGPLSGDPSVQLQTVLDAVMRVEKEAPSKQDLEILRTAFQTMTGSKLDVKRWRESLYERLAANEVVYQIADALKQPRALCELVLDLQVRLGRSVPEEEVVAWLALGAASRMSNRPLLRPVVHAFVRGVGGAVVTFPAGNAGPRLWLSSETMRQGQGDASQLIRLPVITCTTCGQHYFEHFVADFSFVGKAPAGGEAVENRVVWKLLDAKAGGKRAVLLDRLVSADDDDDPDDVPRNTAPVHLCRVCGALHPAPRTRCDGCGIEGDLVALMAVAQKEDLPGKLTSCLACGAFGRRRLGQYREPARPVRALNVSDVHVLAQSMLHHAERRRLLVFSDNRQDAAFQAGWMQDHARRYRLRALMYEQILLGAISVGDLTASLDTLLDRDDDLSRALIPEVWQVERKETAGTRHATERKRFLRYQVLRELAVGPRQRLGLEPWGRMLVEYFGFGADLPFFAEWAPRFQCSPTDLFEGVATLLDQQRRSGVLYDRDGDLFSHYWHESDFEVSRGYIPLMEGGPSGLKLRRGATDSNARVKQIISTRGVTTARYAVAQWGLDPARMESFFEELWNLLTETLKLLVPVTLTGRRNQALPGAVGVTQLDADRLLIHPNRGAYRCTLCRRTTPRRTPKMACPTRFCKGTLVEAPENIDDYNLLMLDQRFTMVRPREHSAQVPADEREILERAFKGDGGAINALVCTPTLELGVDIGALDSVLMRNVPPLPANYWQRVGRAGRRHRMALNLTYARGSSHDRAYFEDPLRMLMGLIQPPRFNLKNEPMVRKHAHASVVTALHQIVSGQIDAGVPNDERQAIADALDQCFPDQIKTYLFDEAEHVRRSPFNLAPLQQVLSQHATLVLAEVGRVFAQNWPLVDRVVVEPDALRRYVAEMPDQLATVIKRLRGRLEWALDQMDRLDRVRARKGTLDPDEDALRTRCDRLVKRLKGKDRRRKREAEGYDDTYTYTVLAAEGFLPGYGLDTGTVVGFHQVTRYGVAGRDWELRRALPLAVREYVPGNLIYANGHRFLPRFFHLEPDDPALFQVDLANGAISETQGDAAAASSGLSGALLSAVPICDVDLPHFSHITDDEDYRFQLPVTVHGYEQRRHGGGTAFSWGNGVVTSRTSVRIRLVNVGPNATVQGTGELGYPVCLVCGQSRSPFASQADLDAFNKDHLDRCGRSVQKVGFFADVVADALCLQGCRDLTEAYSLGEALLRGASEVLEMELSDLQLLVTGRAGDSQHDMLLYDPMPGGSGLLEQMVERWGEVVKAALAFVEGCPAGCASACIDCMLRYRNSFYHAFLDRKLAAELIHERGMDLVKTHDIPPRLPSQASTAQPVNQPEAALRFMLQRAGFDNARPQHSIDLGLPLGVTTPDFFFECPSGTYDGVCIYLDGMSQQLHGEPATRRRDRAIREELRSTGYEVIEVTYGQLSDEQAMRGIFYRLGRILLGKDKAQQLRDDGSWFRNAAEDHRSEHPPAVEPGGWDELIDLLDSPWQPLARGLRDLGVPVADDALWDIPVGGKVSGKVAVLVWTSVTPFVAVVEGEAPGDGCGGTILLVEPGTPAADLAPKVIEALGGEP